MKRKCYILRFNLFLGYSNAVWIVLKLTGLLLPSDVSFYTPPSSASELLLYLSKSVIPISGPPGLCF